MNHWQVRKSRKEWGDLTHGLAVHVLLAADPKQYVESLRGLTFEPDRLPLEKARLAVVWRYRIRRDRDLDNLVAGLKPLIDSLVSAGMIRDDSTACLQEIGPLRVERGSEVDETVLTIEEMT